MLQCQLFAILVAANFILKCITAQVRSPLFAVPVFSTSRQYNHCELMYLSTSASSHGTSLMSSCSIQAGGDTMVINQTTYGGAFCSYSMESESI